MSIQINKMPSKSEEESWNVRKDDIVRINHKGLKNRPNISPFNLMKVGMVEGEKKQCVIWVNDWSEGVVGMHYHSTEFEIIEHKSIHFHL